MTNDKATKSIETQFEGPLTGAREAPVGIVDAPVSPVKKIK